MKHKLMALLFVLGMMLALTASNLEADFIQCPADTGLCPGTDSPDVINGTNSFNNITGMDGNDTIFALDNPIPTAAAIMGKESVGGLMFGVSYFDTPNFADIINGGPGNDFISGGPGHDYIFGEEGNDVMLPGSDNSNYGQTVDGGPGNDTTIVLVGDVSSCLLIYGDTGLDNVNLLGYGPYSAVQPFGIAPAGWTNGWIQVIDPIGGGDIFIEVFENGDQGTETINGLLTPNVTFLNVGFPELNGCMGIDAP